ncbi:DUF547 domain-containing protein [Wenzhouxiangella sp. EGI_FJ10409]|uniref:DUF547 domain-containing protein n=1 Tax=Wenzhouxiangella sp. EGI_FJ10409 TaxID=3243767 RepID=UPI0035D62C3D
MNRLRGPAATLVLLLLAPATYGLDVEDVFEPYAQLLERHVVEHDLDSGGLVSSFDYEAAIAESGSRALIERQRRDLAELESVEFDSRDTALAFWINAYNFFMIAHIVDNSEDSAPVDSVKDFGSLFNPFRVFGLEVFDVAGEERSLDQMEKEILLGDDFARRGWKDARVHFAVNCASVGCPPLRATPYTAGNVEGLLEENTRRAMLTPLHLRIEGDTAWLTSLFDWYKGDFEEAAGSVEAFVENHVEPTRAARFEDARRKRIIDYDWQLNSPANIARWLETTNVGEQYSLDTEARHRATPGRRLSLGASNLTDRYPDRSGEAKDFFGNFAYDPINPIGINGRFVYARSEFIF